MQLHYRIQRIRSSPQTQKMMGLKIFALRGRDQELLTRTIGRGRASHKKVQGEAREGWKTCSGGAVSRGQDQKLFNKSIGRGRAKSIKMEAREVFQTCSGGKRYTRPGPGALQQGMLGGRCHTRPGPGALQKGMLGGRCYTRPGPGALHKHRR